MRLLERVQCTRGIQAEIMIRQHDSTINFLRQRVQNVEMRANTNRDSLFRLLDQYIASCRDLVARGKVVERYALLLGAMSNHQADLLDSTARLVEHNEDLKQRNKVLEKQVNESRKEANCEKESQVAIEKKEATFARDFKALSLELNEATKDKMRLDNEREQLFNQAKDQQMEIDYERTTFRTGLVNILSFTLAAARQDFNSELSAKIESM